MSRNARTSVPRHNYTAPALRWTNPDSHMRVLTTRAALPNNFSFAATRTLHRLAKKYLVLLSRHCEPSRNLTLIYVIGLRDAAVSLPTDIPHPLWTTLA